MNAREMMNVQTVENVVQYINDRLEYLEEEKMKERAMSDNWRLTRTERNDASKRYSLRVGMTNELVIIREMLRNVDALSYPVPVDFVAKAFDVVKSGQLEHMQATYTSDGVVVIVRKPTDAERRI